jgi:hypothetical protein
MSDITIIERGRTVADFLRLQRKYRAAVFININDAWISIPGSTVAKAFQLNIRYGVGGPDVEAERPMPFKVQRSDDYGYHHISFDTASDEVISDFRRRSWAAYDAIRAAEQKVA